MGNLVLIADDDRDIVRFVALNLRLEGFDVVVANNGQERLDWPRRGPSLSCWTDDPE